RPILAENNLFVVQLPEGSHDDLYLKTIIGHVSGEFLSFKTPMILEKKNAQGFGSALTYVRRYSLVSALGLETDDDDGSAASSATFAVKNHKPSTITLQKPVAKHAKQNLISEAQRKRLYALAKGVSEPEIKSIIKEYGYESSKEIEAQNYDLICAKLKTKAEFHSVTKKTNSGV
ncbi:MAG: ERF family protein, partial [Bdellovibrionales bacterium]|nr:ERF family protein [Bdellovibrionales bacterium]